MFSVIKSNFCGLSNLKFDEISHSVNTDINVVGYRCCNALVLYIDYQIQCDDFLSDPSIDAEGLYAEHFHQSFDKTLPCACYSVVCQLFWNLKSTRSKLCDTRNNSLWLELSTQMVRLMRVPPTVNTRPFLMFLQAINYLHVTSQLCF